MATVDQATRQVARRREETDQATLSVRLTNRRQRVAASQTSVEETVANHFAAGSYAEP